MKKRDITIQEFQLVINLAKKLGPDGIEYYLREGELPLVKLNQKEMAFLKGGSGRNLFFDLLSTIANIKG
ncbi:MAG: hypothetical protein H6621_01760 [Halobacteriovoraceae bacterium]|nr:hypothetical protein [Halobacteriovoraceae bacterium]MCB9093768.1 hypothetical protein [Halobacteriovoraceae bacterium]